MKSQHLKPIKKGPLPKPEFSFNLIKVASAQICQSVGLRGAQNSALEALTNIVIRFLQAIAKVAAASANSQGRIESNLLDVVIALEDLGSVQGFRGGSDTKGGALLYRSQVVRDLMEFVKYSDEIPFAQPLHGEFFPRGWNGTLLKDGGFEGEKNWYGSGGKLMHVPWWLPTMPMVGVDEKEEERERKWGCLDAGNEGSIREGKLLEIEGRREIELLGKREKVRFKFGVERNGSGGGGIVGKFRGGVCRGGGIGKRVSCDFWSGSEGSEEEESKMTLGSSS